MSNSINKDKIDELIASIEREVEKARHDSDRGVIALVASTDEKFEASIYATPATVGHVVVALASQYPAIIPYVASQLMILDMERRAQ